MLLLNHTIIDAQLIVQSVVAVMAIRILMNIVCDGGQVAERSGVQTASSVREVKGGCRGDLFGESSLVGKRKKEKVNKFRSEDEGKKTSWLQFIRFHD